MKKTLFLCTFLVCMCIFVSGCKNNDIAYDYYEENNLYYGITFGNGSISSLWYDFYCFDPVVNFNKPINIADSLLPQMFYIISDENDEKIPDRVYLSNDGMSVSITLQNELPRDNYENYKRYWIVINLDDYAKSELFPYDNSYVYTHEKKYHSFSVRNEIVVEFESNVDSNYRNSQYGRHSRFYYGDTVYFNTPGTYNGKNLFIGIYPATV